MSAELFLSASRKAFRYNSVRGEINTEQLWQLPLLSKDGYNLDNVAITVNAELKGLGEESFVKPNQNTAKRKELTDKLEIIKFIIKTKEEQKEKAANRLACKQKADLIRQTIADKQNEQLSAGSIEDLQRQLQELQLQLQEQESAD